MPISFSLSLFCTYFALSTGSFVYSHDLATGNGVSDHLCAHFSTWMTQPEDGDQSATRPGLDWWLARTGVWPCVSRDKVVVSSFSSFIDYWVQFTAKIDNLCIFLTERYNTAATDFAIGGNHLKIPSPSVLWSVALPPWTCVASDIDTVGLLLTLYRACQTCFND